MRTIEIIIEITIVGTIEIITAITIEIAIEITTEIFGMLAENVSVLFLAKDEIVFVARTEHFDLNIEIERKSLGEIKYEHE